jgi:hypothetical protein
LVVPALPGTGRASASSVIAIATTPSEKEMTRWAALASTSGSSGRPPRNCQLGRRPGGVTPQTKRSWQLLPIRDKFRTSLEKNPAAN